MSGLRHRYLQREIGIMSDVPLSQILTGLAGLDRKTVSLDAVTSAMGSRIHGTALLLLVLPEVMPLPISTSAVLGIPLVMISAHLVAFGERAGLPARVKPLALPIGAFRFVARYAVPVLRRLESLSHPRWPGLALKERGIGIACMYLSVILLLPIPFMNAIPAALLALIAWGMTQKDGLVIAIGLFGSILLTIFLFLFTSWVSGALVTFTRTS